MTRDEALNLLEDAVIRTSKASRRRGVLRAWKGDSPPAFLSADLVLCLLDSARDWENDGIVDGDDEAGIDLTREAEIVAAFVRAKAG